METTLKVSANDFQNTIDDHICRGFRLLMIRPADSPSEAILQKPDRQGGLNIIRLVSKIIENGELDSEVSLALPYSQASSNTEWSTGRAGMMYRDLVPNRLGGKLIASHIRIVDGGAVADSVHYHKIDFQVIYCLRGAIKVVYEDQGPPFWLRPGDCVLQPPEIRHRVLEAEAGSEVIEITSPAEHETWFDHDLDLPTTTLNELRMFGSQRFVIHQQSNGDCSPMTETRIVDAGENAPEVFTLETNNTDEKVEITEGNERIVRILIGGRGIMLKMKI